MTLLIVVVIIIGLAGIIGNQYSGLQRMKEMQQSLEDIRNSLREK
jgi:type II secretory pathway pseudopilin PulG